MAETPNLRWNFTVGYKNIFKDPSLNYQAQYELVRVGYKP